MNFFKIWMAFVLCIGFQHTANSQITKTMNSAIKSKGLRTTIYKVDDLSAAKKWYAKAFGTEPYFDTEYYVGFNIGGYELGLLPETVQKPKTTNVLSYWGVDDITDAYDKMVTNGAKELEIPTDVGDGIKVALVKDPWENVIGIIYNPYFKGERKPDKAVIEWAPFRLKDGITEQSLLTASDKIQNEFLLQQKGFIKRELLKKSDTEWIDLVYWEDKASAELALQKANNSEVCAAYFGLMQFDENAETSLAHFELASEY